MNKQTVAVLDFGSQYTQLIARRIREQNVYSKILPHTISVNDIKERNISAIILFVTGFHILAWLLDLPASTVNEAFNKSIFSWQVLKNMRQ